MKVQGHPTFVVGAYPATPPRFMTPQAVGSFVGEVVRMPVVSGLELPFVTPGEQWLNEELIGSLEPGLRHVITLIPATMIGMNDAPGFGLASTDEDGRRRALDTVRSACDWIRSIEESGRGTIAAVEVQSAPRQPWASSVAFGRSLEELTAWDWGSTRLLIEHCDAPVEGQVPEKGFLSLEQEIRLARDVGVGILINWGRSVIERRSVQGAVEQVDSVVEAGCAEGMIFSGVSDRETLFGGPWVDAHLALRESRAGKGSGPGDELATSLMTRDAVAEVARRLDPATLAVVGIKIGAPPSWTDEQRRDLVLRNVGVIADELASNGILHGSGSGPGRGGLPTLSAVAGAWSRGRHAPVELIAPKGLPPEAPGDLGKVSELGWDLFTAGFHWPIAVLHESALRRNSATMAAYCERHGVSLAPHGKTTMAPDLFHLQLADGAWAISAATVWQARVMKAAAVSRVIIANQVVTVPEIAWLADALADPGFEVCCYVDSLHGVDLLERTLARLGSPRPLPVLVELGARGGRTGARTVPDAVEVAMAVGAADGLTLLGVSAFEGIFTDGEGVTARQQVESLLDGLSELTVRIDGSRGFDDAEEVVVTAGGSQFFDLVVERFSQLSIDRPLRRVIRSGNYLTHADGGYELTSPMGAAPRLPEEQGRLEAAMEVWGAVLSRPEPTRAIVGLGKRDVSPDGALPVVRAVRDAEGHMYNATATAVALNDQHTYLDVPADSSIAVGDLVACGVWHGCTTFDRWRAIPVVDDRYRVQQVIRTYF